MVKAFNTQEFRNMVAVLTAEHWETVFTEEVITSLQIKYGMMEEDRNQAAVSVQHPGGPYSVRPTSKPSWMRKRGQIWSA